MGVVIEVYVQCQMEKFDCGVVVIYQLDGKVFVSWCLLVIDFDGVSFNVYCMIIVCESECVDYGMFVVWFDVGGGMVKVNVELFIGGIWLIDVCVMFVCIIEYSV